MPIFSLSKSSLRAAIAQNAIRNSAAALELATHQVRKQGFSVDIEMDCLEGAFALQQAEIWAKRALAIVESVRSRT